LPVELIYFEAYRSRKHAYNREKNLKKYGNGLARLKSRIEVKRKEELGENKKSGH
jgi:predicted GIY-YIG superfamily endonuclease